MDFGGGSVELLALRSGDQKIGRRKRKRCGHNR